MLFRPFVRPLCLPKKGEEKGKREEEKGKNGRESRGGKGEISFAVAKCARFTLPRRKWVRAEPNDLARSSPRQTFPSTGSSPAKTPHPSFSIRSPAGPAPFSVSQRENATRLMTLLREALTIPCFQDRRDSKKTYRERSMPIFLRITIEIIKQIYIYISRVTNKRILFSFFETTRHVPTCYTAVNLAHAYKDFPLIKKKRRERGRGGGRQRKNGVARSSAAPRNVVSYSLCIPWDPFLSESPRFDRGRPLPPEKRKGGETLVVEKTRYNAGDKEEKGGERGALGGRCVESRNPGWVVVTTA